MVDAIGCAESWDDVVEQYEIAYEPFTQKYGFQMLDLLAIKNGDQVLDIAAGTGATAVEACCRGALVTAVDFSPAMVSRIMQRAADIDGTPDRFSAPNLIAKVMSGEQLTLEDSSFDTVYSVFGMMFFDDRASSYAEALRVLKPGGNIANVCWGLFENNEASLIFQRAMKLAFPDRVAANTAPPGWATICEPKNLIGEMTVAGFSDVELITVSHAWDIPSAHWLWRVLPNISPVSASLFTSFSEQELVLLKHAYLEILSQTYGEKSFSLSATANICIGAKGRF